MKLPGKLEHQSTWAVDSLPQLLLVVCCSPSPITEGSMPSSSPASRSYSPASFWGDITVWHCWPGEVYGGLRLLQHSVKCSLPHLTATGSLVVSERASLVLLTVWLGIHQSFLLLLCFSLWAKHGGHSSCFSWGHYCLWHLAGSSYLSDWGPRRFFGDPPPPPTSTQTQIH